jgi:hypothetical protein
MKAATGLTRRMERESRTIAAMIALYCRQADPGGEAMKR